MAIRPRRLFLKRLWIVAEQYHPFRPAAKWHASVHQIQRTPPRNRSGTTLIQQPLLEPLSDATGYVQLVLVFLNAVWLSWVYDEAGVDALVL